MLRALIGGAVEVDTALGADLWPALVDPTQIEGRCSTSRSTRATRWPMAGRLTIEPATSSSRRRPTGTATRAGRLRRRSRWPTPATACRRKSWPRAFEPFFTTKEVGKGTGLGLSQVYGLARQSGGIARIRSKPGAGTKVEIYLPRAPAAASSALLSEGDGAEGSVRRRGTVLIVDDQEDVREFAAVHLETLGYQTIHAANGRTALDLLEAGGAAVDVLLVDYAMPGMSGVDVIRAIRQVRPDLPVVLMTGYADIGALSERLSHVVLLNKPFRLHELGGSARSRSLAASETPGAGK